MLRSFVRCSQGLLPSVTPQSERLHAMFKELDIDGSGKLEVAEVAKVGFRHCLCCRSSVPGLQGACSCPQHGNRHWIVRWMRLRLQWKQQILTVTARWTTRSSLPSWASRSHPMRHGRRSNAPGVGGLALRYHQSARSLHHTHHVRRSPRLDVRHDRLQHLGGHHDRLQHLGGRHGHLQRRGDLLLPGASPPSATTPLWKARTRRKGPAKLGAHKRKVGDDA